MTSRILVLSEDNKELTVNLREPMSCADAHDAVKRMLIETGRVESVSRLLVTQDASTRILRASF
jgi:hypothetical protein